jgi:hypothetical protein
MEYIVGSITGNHGSRITNKYLISHDILLERGMEVL